MFGVTSLFIYIREISVCVSLGVGVCVAVSEEIDIHHALADTMSLNDWVNFFVNDDNDSDFKPIFDLHLYYMTYTVSICLRKKLASTYLPGRLIREYIRYTNRLFLSSFSLVYFSVYGMVWSFCII